jgi:nucleoside-diphosphate-sugar epimerase
MRSDDPVLLLTGATGLVGSEVLHHLVATRPNRQIIVLARQRHKISRLDLHARVIPLQGDLTQPHLGLDDACFADLQRSVTEIMHCAADTRFGQPLEQARMTNREGTRNLLALASCCRKLTKFAYVSTVFVAGRSTGLMGEAPLRHHSGFCNTYQQAKYEAEGLVFESMPDIPAAVFRLSSIIGDSTTGQVRQFNYIHQLLRVFPRSVLPIAPGEPTAPIDLIPSDWAGAALAYLFDASFVPGRVYHVCAGPDASLTVGQIIDWTLELFESHPRARRWLPIRLPKLVSLAQYEAYVERSRGGDDILLKELLRVLGFFLPHLGMFQAFDNTQTRESLAASHLQLPNIRDYYSKVVHYCLETNWGRQMPYENYGQR